MRLIEVLRIGDGVVAGREAAAGRVDVAALRGPDAVVRRHVPRAQRIARRVVRLDAVAQLRVADDIVRDRLRRIPEN